MTEITNPDRKYIMKFNGENIEMVYENIQVVNNVRVSPKVNSDSLMRLTGIEE